MKTFTALFLAVLLLAGCAAPAVVTTEPPAGTTQPPVTTAPRETTLPPETTEPLDPEEAAVRATVDAFLTIYQQNVFLYTDIDYDYLTVLAADPDATVEWKGRSVRLSEFHKNILFYHDREAYWKHIRQTQGITRQNYESMCHFDRIEISGDTATVTVSLGYSFVYDDDPTGNGSGGFEDFELLLVRVDGNWLVADVLSLWDWFDGQYKDDPDFDVDKLIEEYIPC